jgi:hypothetical protein
MTGITAYEEELERHSGRAGQTRMVTVGIGWGEYQGLFRPVWLILQVDSRDPSSSEPSSAVFRTAC